MTFTSDLFLASRWQEAASSTTHGYHSLKCNFQELAEAYHREASEVLSNMMNFFASLCSMALTPESPNEPYRPFITSSNSSSMIPDDLTEEDLIFIESILVHIDFPILKARLADILWLCKRPRRVEHARIVISSYLALPITSEEWKKGEQLCWERAIALSFQVKDFTTIDIIKQRLAEALTLSYEDFPLMRYRIGESINRTNLFGNDTDAIAQTLFEIGDEITVLETMSLAFHIKRSYFKVSEKLFRKAKEFNRAITCQVRIAETFVKEAEQRLSGENPNPGVANSFYEDALQAYRKVPQADRAEYNVERKLEEIEQAILRTGAEALENMYEIRTDGIDLSTQAEQAIAHVTNKHPLEMAILYFTGFITESYTTLREQASASLAEPSFLNTIGRTIVSQDGRMIARTPSISNNNSASDDELIIFSKIMEIFNFNLSIIVNGTLIPALDQIIMEHRITKDDMEALCFYSSIIPRSYNKSVANALWYGFERDFRTAIYLLCPQIENIIRQKLKSAGVNTTNTDENGITQEVGMGTLLNFDSATDLFGENLCFELKAIFTDALGPNLRNNIAHGLLDDDSSNSEACVYAWWLTLKTIIEH
ncbi:MULTISPECIES: DUF4209 domain-containing protein [Enterobacter cloacae complex]|uniref:DUF4209 domain-containing protein n=1 Tax=Enterobacter cloacae complex TaxID=354276 RepID=UPI001A547168|nr:DUF4209 domain-containing protein [Enterobacter hormaechei]MCU3473764.1 DUF4209 domain-containing protein [Enterobacter hormaechei subsp. steigerwaltii]MBK4265858.1 DUF4209 domain-containing protein [Enterobacter hormaechei]MBT1819792.1 DUF4209 domain-containing protein [Enterobacter hormaechei subsp. xiangfangensis]MBT2039387.1 DUF4209 domain-containing protein [Enterobacter hormaechei subsp. xiangfangensis]MCL8122430.1 DUF4209 domain-containing protein [Enterobacter hormaechei]